MSAVSYDQPGELHGRDAPRARVSSQSNSFASTADACHNRLTRRQQIGPGAMKPMPLKDYRARVELNERVSSGHKAQELRRQLADYQPSLSRNAHGKTEILMTVPSQDIWLSILTVMAAIKSCWYEPCAVEVMVSDELDRRKPAT